MKNYILTLINKKEILLTAQEAASIAQAMVRSQGSIKIGSGMYPVHQISSLERIDSATEKDLCDIHKIEEAPVMEQYLKGEDNLLLN